MKITIKCINGQSCIIDVNGTTRISEIKQKIANLLNIPLSHQLLVLFGKTLQDDKTVDFYPLIKDGTKLYLAIKKPEELDVVLYRFLLQYYTESQSEKIVFEFLKDFHERVKELSFDDLERIAKADGYYFPSSSK